MASFNPGIEPVQNNFLHYARGQIPNDAMGTLFKGLGDIVQGAGKTIDTSIQNNIKKDVYKDYDTANDVFGVNSAAQVKDQQMGVPSPGQVPQDIAESRTYLNRLSQARAAGSIQDSHYWAKLEMNVKGLYAKYPGYRDQIDNIVQGVTGATPANALRSSLMNEIDSAARTQATETNKMDSFVNSNGKDADPVLLKDYLNGDRTHFAELQLSVFKRQREDANVTHDNAQLALLDNRQKLEDKKVYQGALNSATLVADRALSTSYSALGKNITEVMQNISKMGADGLDDKEVAQVLPALAQMKMQVENAIGQKLIEPWTEDSTSNFAGKLSGTQVDDIKKQAIAPIEHLIQAVTDKNVGMIGLNAAVNSSSIDDKTKQLINGPNGEFWTTTAAISKMGAAPWMGAIMMRDSTSFNAATVSLKNAMLGKIATTGEPVDTAVKTLLNSGVVDSKDPTPVTKLINDGIAGLTDSSQPIQMRMNLAKSYFSPQNADFLKNFPQSNWSTLFQSLTTPAMAKSIIELSQTDPTIGKNYQDWVEDKFQNVYSPLLGSIQSDLKTAGQRGGITYDLTGNQFVVDNGKSESVGSRSGMANSASAALDLRSRMRDVNQFLIRMEPVWKANGEKPQDAAQALAEKMGIPLAQEPAKSSEGKQSSNDQTGGGIQLASFENQPVDDGGERQGGSRSWRNRNPGNIEAGRFADAHGATGSDGRFAIFPSEAAGQEAMKSLLFHSKGYAGLTVSQAIKKYAPPSENNTLSYVNSVTRPTGIDAGSSLSDLSEDEQARLVMAMAHHEGWRPGKVVASN